MSFIRNGLCAVLLSLSATMSQAAVQTVSFEVEVIGDLPAYVGTMGFGAITYDDAALTGVGEEAMAINAYTADPFDPFDYDVAPGLLGFSLTLFPGTAIEQTFTAADDEDYPDFPELYFYDGQLFGTDYLVDEHDVAILAPGVHTLFAAFFPGLGGEFFPAIPGGDAAYLTVVLVSADIPVPAALPLMLGGLGWLGVAARRRKG